MNYINEGFICLVKSKIGFLSKSDIVQLALDKSITDNKGISKTAAQQLILAYMSEDLAKEITGRYSHIIGFTSFEVEDMLQINKSERTKLTKKKLLNVTGYYEVKSYGKVLLCPVYDAAQILGMSANDIETLKSSIKPASEAQLNSLKLAKEIQTKSRTCVGCGFIVGSKKELYDGMCRSCLQYQLREERMQEAMSERKSWLNNKDKYAILDTETTGLHSDDEIIEIAIIDLDGKVLLNTLVKPIKPISREAFDKHGISNDYIIGRNFPTWDQVHAEVNRILQERTIIAYNSNFDVRLLCQTSMKYGLVFDRINHVCLMDNVTRELSLSKNISLLAASGADGQSHRALDDCMLCLDIIRKGLEDSELS